MLKIAVHATTPAASGTGTAHVRLILSHLPKISWTNKLQQVINWIFHPLPSQCSSPALRRPACMDGPNKHRLTPQRSPHTEPVATLCSSRVGVSAFLPELPEMVQWTSAPWFWESSLHARFICHIFRRQMIFRSIFEETREYEIINLGTIKNICK